MNYPRPTEQRKTMDLHPAEARLIEYLRRLQWGNVEITMQDALPVLVKAAVQTTKLT